MEAQKQPPFSFSFASSPPLPPQQPQPPKQSSQQKRSRSQQIPSSSKTKKKLGITEFCSILNNNHDDDDDEFVRKNESAAVHRAKKIIKILKLFVTTVRKERRESLLLFFLKEQQQKQEKLRIGEEEEDGMEEEEEEGYNSGSSDDDDDDDESESDDDEEQQPQRPRKKSRLEKKHKWMDDTQGWNNPFVGTSTSSTATISNTINPQKEYGTIQPNAWPTGLLHAYLQSSPRAIELLCYDYMNDKKKKKKKRDGSNNEHYEEEEEEEEGSGGGEKRRSSSDVWMYPHGKNYKSIQKSTLTTQFHKKGGSSSCKSTKKDWSKEIYSVYLQVLSEIVTVYIPKEVLLRDLLWMEQQNMLSLSSSSKKKKRGYDVDFINQLIIQQQQQQSQSQSQKVEQQQQQEYQNIKILSLLHKKYVPHLFHLLNEETSYGKNQPASTTTIQSSSKRGDQKDEQHESLVACVFHLLATLSKTLPYSSSSSENSGGGGGGGMHINIARDIVKQMDESLYPNVLQLCCCSTSSSSSSKPPIIQKRKKWKVLQNQSEYLHLSSVLLECSGGGGSTSGCRQDEFIMSYITTQGNMERKQNVGLVTVALRHGLQYYTSTLHYQEEEEEEVREEKEKKKGQRKGGGGGGVKDVYLYMARFLSAVRRYLLPSSNKEEDDDGDEEVDEKKKRRNRRKHRGGGRSGGGRHDFILGLRTMMDLLGGEALNRLTNLSAEAPPLTESNSFQSVLSIRDTFDNDDDDNDDDTLINDDGIVLAAIEARRLLFLLVSDPQRSPFLVHIHAAFNRFAPSSSSSFPIGSPTQLQQQLTRSIASLTIGGVSSKRKRGGGGGVSAHAITTIPARAFVVHCMSQSPELLPALFRIIPTSEPKPTFRCMSSLACVLHLLRECPPAYDCLPPIMVESGNNSALQRRRLPPKTEQMMPYILPMSTTKNILSKGIQNRNPLIVSETLKLIAAIIERSRIFIENVKSSFSSNSSTTNDIHDEFLSSFADVLRRRLPDVQPLLSIRTRFDPFTASAQENSLSETANTFVVIHLCEVLQLYGAVIPQALQTVKFDWTKKLLPDDCSLFLRAKPVLQCRMLRTVQKLASIPLSDTGASMKFSSKAFCSLLTIVTNSSLPQVYKVARELALVAFLGSSFFDDTYVEVDHCLRHEATLWIDGITSDSVSELGRLVDTSQSLIVQHKIVTAQAWGRYRPNDPMPALCFSPFLTTALGAISALPTDCSKKFILLVCQVATKLLLYHLDATLLAVFICHCFKDTDGRDDVASPSLKLLRTYAEAWLSRKNESSGALKSLVSILFASDSVHANISNLSVKSKSALGIIDDQSCLADFIGNRYDGEMCLVIIRQCMHQLSQIDTSMNKDVAMKDLQALLKFALIEVLQVGEKPVQKATFHTLFGQNGDTGGINSAYMGCHLFLALSNQFSSGEKRPDADTVLDGCIKGSIKLYANIITASKKDQLLSGKPIERLNISTIALLWPFLPHSFLVPLVSALLVKCSEQRSPPKCSYQQQFYFSLTQSLIKKSSEGNFCSFFDSASLISSVFTLWTSLASAIESGSLDSLSIRLCLEVEKILSRALIRSEKHGLASSIIYCDSQEISPETVVQLCITTLSCTGSHPPMTEKSDKRTEEAMLPSLLYYDCSTFGLCFTNILAHLQQYPDAKRLWDRGELDTSVQILIHQLEEQHVCSKILVSDLYVKMLTVIVMRAQKLINNSVKKEPTSSGNHSVIIFTDILKVIIPQGYIEEKVLYTILSTLSKILLANEKSHQKSNVVVEENVLLASTSIVTKGFKVLDGDMASKHLKLISTATFLRLCVLLPKFLKKGLRVTEENKMKHGKFDLHGILMALIDITTKIDIFDDVLILSRIRTINRCLLICLKYGVSEDNGHCSSWKSAMCLRFVRQLVVKACAPPYPLCVLSKNDVVNTARIHAMLVSHSKFGSVLAYKENDLKKTEDSNQGLAHKSADENVWSNWSIKLELVHLMICCTSLCSESIRIDAETWSCIIAGYNAGLCPVDCSLRRLMYLYDEKVATQNQKRSHLMKFDELSWGKFRSKFSLSSSMGKNMGIDHGRQWEWFIYSLEQDRVRATLIQFPTWDSLEPRPNGGIEVWENKPIVNADDIELNGSIDDDINSLLSEIDSETAEDVFAKDEQAKCNNARFLFSDSPEKWHGSGPDIRYSPAFILPLILGVLDAFLPPSIQASKITEKEECLDKYEKNNAIEERMHYDGRDVNICSVQGEEAAIARHQSFAQIAHRLSDKGGIALALVTLSSKCPSLRKVAVATLGLFLKALHSNEAKDISSWRERPQLAMILDSVQRGLSIKRAMQLLKRRSNSEADDGSRKKYRFFFIPQLPVVSAIFLARASFIVSKPNHYMYSPINRLFLRLEDHHGAYQDCHGLPAFISFFCSSSEEDPSQARSERGWALQLLKDGTLDSYCYTVAARRHTPELLLASFHHGGDDGERGLLLDTIESMLRFGGKGAASHIIGRMGLLSWLRGILEGNSTLLALHTITIRCKFLRLITFALQVAALKGTDAGIALDTAAMEASNLCRPVMALYIETDHPLPLDKNKSNRDSGSILAATCGTLWAMSAVLKKSSHFEQKFLFGSVRRQGIPVQSSLILLSSSRSKSELYQKVVEALCVLPCAGGSVEESTCIKFCHLVLSFIQDHSESGSSIVLDVLRRVTLLSRQYCNCFNKSGIITQVLASRRKSLTCMGGLKVWVDCLESARASGSISQNKNAICKISEFAISSKLIRLQTSQCE